MAETYSDLVSCWECPDGLDGPGLHALIIGISCYPYLNKGTKTPRAEFRNVSESMGQLSGPSITAADLAQLLISKRKNLSAPLKSCTLLLSPSPNEPPEFRKITDANWQNINLALHDWRARLSKHSDSVGIFHFSGHGIQKDKATPILLASDFLSGTSLLDCAIDALEIRCGMAITKSFENIARKQFYFFDACKNDVENFAGFQISPRRVFDIQTNGDDERNAPIFFSAPPGVSALSMPGKGTRFGIDLIDCLAGAGADLFQGGNGQPAWVVTLGSLASAMTKLAAQYNSSIGSKVRWFVSSELSEHDTPILHLDAAPSVACTFRYDPDSFRKSSSMELIKSNPSTRIPVLDENPATMKVEGGIYAVKAASGVSLTSDHSIFIKPPKIDHTFYFGK